MRILVAQKRYCTMQLVCYSLHFTLAASSIFDGWWDR